MRRYQVVSLLSLLGGISLAVIALFAHTLSLDEHAGWGRMRTLVLTAGLLLLFTSAGLQFFAPQIDDASRRFLDRVATWLSVRPRLKAFLSGWAEFIKKYRLTVPAVAAVMLMYFWLATSGTWGIYSRPHYYADLARAFQQGRLHLLTRPSRALLEMPDPYDPEARGSLATPIDYTLYNGRYYLYWGPVPAVLLAAAGPSMPHQIVDQDLVLAYSLVSVLVLYLFLLIVRDRFFPALPSWMLQLSILLAGLTFPATFMLDDTYSARMIYEAAIFAAQFFFVSGLLAAWISTSGNSVRAWQLALAGAFWSLAFGTRLLLLLPTLLITLLILIRLLRTPVAVPAKVTAMLALTLPLLIGLIGLGWYNWARFGSVTETGFSYALAGVNLRRHSDELWGLQYIMPNLYNYLLYPPATLPEFPFIQPLPGERAPVLPIYSVPDFYWAPVMSGFTYLAPICVYALVSIRSLWSEAVNRLRGGPAAREQGSAELVWLIAILFSAVAPVFALHMTFFWAGMRYVGDFMPSLLLLSLIGFWHGYTSFSKSRAFRNAYVTAAVALATITLLLSTLMAIAVNDVRLRLIATFS